MKKKLRYFFFSLLATFMLPFYIVWYGLHEFPQIISEIAQGYRASITGRL